MTVPPPSFASFHAVRSAQVYGRFEVADRDRNRHGDASSCGVKLSMAENVDARQELAKKARDRAANKR